MIRVHVIQAVRIGEERVGMVGRRKDALVSDKMIRFVPGSSVQFIDLVVVDDLVSFLHRNLSDLTVV